MRATQKKGYPTRLHTTTAVPVILGSAPSLAGQPTVANGHRPDENHVEHVLVLPQRHARAELGVGAPARPAERATKYLPAWPSAYHTGMRWPHQSCRETHQSWMFLAS